MLCRKSSLCSVSTQKLRFWCHARKLGDSFKILGNYSKRATFPDGATPRNALYEPFN